MSSIWGSERNVQPLTPIVSLRDSLSPENAKKFTDDLFEKRTNPVKPDVMRDASLQVEFVDKALGYDSGALAANAFYRGGLIGEYVINLTTPHYKIERLTHRVLRNMYNWTYNVTSEIPDGDSRRMARAQKILDLGKLGCEMYPGLTAAVEEVEDEIIDDPTKSLFIRPGMGFMLSALNKALDKRVEIELNTDLIRMKTEIEDIDTGKVAMDWDHLPWRWTNVYGQDSHTP